jgi:hypothetical protein
MSWNTVGEKAGSKHYFGTVDFEVTDESRDEWVVKDVTVNGINNPYIDSEIWDAIYNQGWAGEIPVRMNEMLIRYIVI